MQPRTFLNRIIRLLLLFIGFNILGSIVSLLLLNSLFNVDGAAVLSIISNSDVSNNGANALKFMQFIQVFFSFIIPAHLFARSESFNNSTFYFKMNQTNYIHFVLGALLIFTLAPIVSYLSVLNESVQLPSTLNKIESFFKTQQATNEKFTLLFLRENTGKDLFINIFIVGVLASIAEELFFRGVLQRILIERIKNIHIAIFICSLLFSALHQEFYNLIPRVLLGMILGYAFVFSNSIWVPILMHFINNTAAVVLDSLYKQGITTFNPNSNEYFGYVGLFISIIISISLFWYWNKNRSKIIYIHGTRLD